MKYGPKMRSGDLSKLKNDLRRQENDLRRLPPSLKWLPKSPDIRTSISQNMHQCKGAGSRVHNGNLWYLHWEMARFRISCRKMT